MIQSMLGLVEQRLELCVDHVTMVGDAVKILNGYVVNLLFLFLLMAAQPTPKILTKVLYAEYRTSLVMLAMNASDGDKAQEPLSIAAWLKDYGIARMHR